MHHSLHAFRHGFFHGNCCSCMYLLLASIVAQCICCAFMATAVQACMGLASMAAAVHMYLLPACFLQLLHVVVCFHASSTRHRTFVLQNILLILCLCPSISGFTLNSCQCLILFQTAYIDTLFSSAGLRAIAVAMEESSRCLKACRELMHEILVQLP